MKANGNNQIVDEQVRAYYEVQRLADERVARILAVAAGNRGRVIRWRQ